MKNYKIKRSVKKEKIGNIFIKKMVLLEDFLINKNLVKRIKSSLIKGKEDPEAFEAFKYINIINRLSLIAENKDRINELNKSLFNALSYRNYSQNKPIDTLDRIIELIIEGVNVNARDEFYMTPLMHAASLNEKTLVELFIKTGADVNAQDDFGWSAITYTNDVKTTEILIKYGADVNIRDHAKSTPLIRAVKINKKELVKLLIKHGAKVNITDKFGRSPLMYAIMYNLKDIEKILKENGAKY